MRERVKRERERGRAWAESSAGLSLINNAWWRAASSVPSSQQPELRQRRRGGLFQGTGGAARWDEREGWCSHLHLSPPGSFFSLSSLSNSPTGITFWLYLLGLCRVILPTLCCPLRLRLRASQDAHHSGSDSFWRVFFGGRDRELRSYCVFSLFYNSVVLCLTSLACQIIPSRNFAGIWGLCTSI